MANQSLQCEQIISQNIFMFIRSRTQVNNLSSGLNLKYRHLLWKEDCFCLAANIQTTFTRLVIYAAWVWIIFSGLFKSTHRLLLWQAVGTEQARCCHPVALQHSAITFIDFLFDGIIWSLYRSQMKWSSVLLAQLNVQGPFSNTVNCISKRINDTFVVTISFFWCHLISSVKWLHQ